MHVEIKAQCRRGLRIIEEIPDIRPCKIEGYNGIGKTSAIRLLQICTGEQPFEGNDSAWSSFRNQLIEARVLITGLQGAQRIEWILKPSDWPKGAVYPLGDEIGQVFIDGKKATIQEVRPLLKVHRINTTETPVTILSEQASAAGSALEGWYSAQGRRRGDLLDNALKAVLERLGEESTDTVRLARQVAKETQTVSADLIERTSRVRRQVQLLERAVEIADRLDTVRGSTPQMRRKLQELKSNLVDLDAKREDLNQKIADAQVQKHLSEQAEEKIRRLERLIGHHDAALRRVTTELEQAAATAGISSSRRDAARTARLVEEELTALVDSQPFVSQGPQLLAVLSDLARRLEDAISAGLGESILLDEDGPREAWTIANLREAFQVQASRLIERGRTSDADQLERKISAARRRLDALANVEELLSAVSKEKRLLSNAEQRYASATAALPGGANDRLKELIGLRNELDRDGRDLQSRIDRLNAEIDLIAGGNTEEVLASEFDLICREVGVDPARVRGSLERTRTELNELSEAAAIAQAKEAAATREFDERVAKIDKVTSFLASSDEVIWLRRAVPRVGNLESLELDQRLNEFEALERLLRDVRDTVNRTVSAVNGIGAAFYELAKQLRDGTPVEQHSQSWTWTHPVRQWLAREARLWFDDEIMREALFEGGEDVRLDPDRLMVSWTLGEERPERPLSGFSSGQQTFAFTRARVAQLEREAGQVANRLIALDEFGAFMDADRFASLSDYLVERQSRLPNDHVVVILPCTVRSPVATAKGGTHNSAKGGTHSSQDTDLARRGYFAESLRS